MLTFYEIVTDEQSTKTIEKREYKETDEVLKLKEILENEIAQYEKCKIETLDRVNYYVDSKYTYPLSLSNSVFEEQKLVGYILDDGVFAPVGKLIIGKLDYNMPMFFSRRVDIIIQKK
ncbi:MAG: hypothetical protein IKY78_07220 [Clostridia bacterium]|nr:hypothetical protein [Clostridia bacterium]